MWGDVFVHVKMYEFVGVMLKDSIEHSDMVLKDTVKLFLLVNGEMCTIVCNCTNTIFRCQYAGF